MKKPSKRYLELQGKAEGEIIFAGITGSLGLLGAGLTGIFHIVQWLDSIIDGLWGGLLLLGLWEVANWGLTRLEMLILVAQKRDVEDE